MDRQSRAKWQCGEGFMAWVGSRRGDHPLGLIMCASILRTN